MARFQKSGELPARTPFEFDRTLDFVRLFTPCAGEQHVAHGALVKAIAVGERPIGFEISEGERGVRYTLHADAAIDARTESAARDRLAFFLGLDDAVEEFYALAAPDQAMSAPLQRWRGMHHVKFATPFENAAWAVLGQRTPIAVARKVKDALVARCETSVEVAGTLHRAFPTPAQLLELAPTELAALAGERKARYLRAVSKAFLEIDGGFLRCAPFDEVERWLLGIDGIGAWSSHFVLFRGLGRGEVLPFTRPLVQAASRHYRASEPELRRIAAGYGPWQGYWALYLRA